MTTFFLIVHRSSIIPQQHVKPGERKNDEEKNSTEDDELYLFTHFLGIRYSMCNIF